MEAKGIYNQYIYRFSYFINLILHIVIVLYLRCVYCTAIGCLLTLTNHPLLLFFTGRRREGGSAVGTALRDAKRVPNTAWPMFKHTPLQLESPKSLESPRHEPTDIKPTEKKKHSHKTRKTKYTLRALAHSKVNTQTQMKKASV